MSNPCQTVSPGVPWRVNIILSPQMFTEAAKLYMPLILAELVKMLLAALADKGY